MVFFLLSVVAILLSVIGHVLWGCGGMLAERKDDDSSVAIWIGSAFSTMSMICAYAAGYVS